jgi:hypothetical protein
MEKITVGAIEMTWDSEARLAMLGFARETRATGQDAAQLIEALTRWVGTEGIPFGLLGDGGRLSGLDAEYRSAWGKFFQQHRRDSVVAFFNMGPVIRIAAEMFRIGTGLRLKAFDGEAEARAWLRTMGIVA